MHLLKNCIFCLALVFINVCIVSRAFPSNNGRIVGGKTAEPGQFPYLVSFQVHLGGFDDHFCDASILNKQWILTAAHCLLDLETEEAYIIAGTNQLDVGGSKYNVSKLIPHPQFNIYTTDVWHDIGLVKIDGEFEFADTIAAIEIGEVSANESCVIAGWTVTRDDSPYPLEYVEVAALSAEDCSTLAEGSKVNDKLTRGPGQVCAFSPTGGMGTCYSGAGIPLVSDNTLVGLGTYTLDNDCAHEYPEVFTRVSYYVIWIQETITNN